MIGHNDNIDKINEATEDRGVFNPGKEKERTIEVRSGADDWLQVCMLDWQQKVGKKRNKDYSIVRARGEEEWYEY